jgi:diguanylate cyclase (GGDEF)-like protein
LTGSVAGRRRSAAELQAARDEAELRVSEARAVEASEQRRAAEAERIAAELAIADRPGESVIDPETGLLDHRIFAVTFERKVAAARRHLRPLSVVLVDIGPALPVETRDRESALRAWGSVIEETLRESDVPCRVGDATFGIILEDTPESGGVWVAERLQIAAACRGAALPGPFRAAVSSYPNHGLCAEEVLGQGWTALERARSRAADGMRFGPIELPAPDQ